MKQIQQEHYSGKREEYQLVIPLELGVKIGEDEPVRLMSRVMEEMDYSKLKAACPYWGRKGKATPRHLAKVTIFGYMNETTSARGLEEACRYDLRYQWLLEGKPAPDHNTIARFRNEKLTEALEDLFYQFVRKLHDLGEIGYENVYVDGTKIEAYANKYDFVFRKAVMKNEEKLNHKVDLFIGYIQREYDPFFPADATLEDIRQLLLRKQQKEGIVFVKGKGNHKTKLQQDMETLEEMYVRQLKYDEYNEIFKGRNSFSKGDHDATYMHMKEDAMRNGQLKPGYNVQLGVEAEYVVGVDVGPERNDLNTLIPLLERMEKGIGQRYENLIADAGYESEENYEYLKASGQVSYIKPQNYEKSKTRRWQTNGYLIENMPYDAQTDTYTCPGGHIMRPVGLQHSSSKTGYVSEITVYEGTGCQGCPLKGKCTHAKGNRKLSVSKRMKELRAESLANVLSPKGIVLRINRSIQSEGMYGNLKENLGFRRFRMRGTRKVFTEVLLYAMACNMNKLYNKIRQNRTGVMLHVKNVS
jgi:transposase